MKTNARILIEYQHMAPQIVADFAHVGNACECAATYNPGPYADAVAVEEVMDGKWCTTYRRHITHTETTAEEAAPVQ